MIIPRCGVSGYFYLFVFFFFFFAVDYGMAQEQTFLFYGNDHQVDSNNWPNQSMMLEQQDGIASMAADATYGWGAFRAEETERTYSGNWAGQIKFATALPQFYVVGYGVLVWNPATNTYSEGLTYHIMGDGTKRVFDISLTGDVTVPAGHHLAFGLNNLQSVTGAGYESFDIVTAENGGLTFPSYLSPPNSSPSFYFLGNDYAPDPVNHPNLSIMLAQKDETATLYAGDSYGWGAFRPEETDMTYSGSWTGQIKFATAPPDNYVFGYSVLSWNPDTEYFVHGPHDYLTGDGSTRVFNWNLKGVITVPKGHHLAMGINNVMPGSGYQSFEIVTAESDGTVKPSFLTGPLGYEAEYPVEGHPKPFYFLGDDHRPDPVNRPDGSMMLEQQDGIASMAANSTYGWGAFRAEETERTYSGNWAGQVKFATAPPQSYIVGYGVLIWNPVTNTYSEGLTHYIIGNGTQKVFTINLNGDVTVPAGHHLAFGLNNLQAVTGAGYESFDIITAENDGLTFPSYLSPPNTSPALYFLGHDYEPDPVNWPNQSIMLAQKNETATLPAGATYGWGVFRPEETDMTYSGTWTGQIKFDTAPPDNYVFAYAPLSWNPDTGEFFHGPSGLLTGDGSTTVFDLYLQGAITVQAGHHLVLGINNALPGSGDQSFEIVTAENDGTVRPSFLYIPFLYSKPVDHSNLINWNNNLVADFGNNGLWYHDGSSWVWMTNRGHVDQMAVWDGKLVVDFGADYGLHYYEGGSWHWMSNKGDVALMLSWDDGVDEKLVVDFGDGRQMYIYDGSWHWFNNKDAVADMLVWNNKLVVDFGNGRSVFYHNGSSWTWMTNKDDVAIMLPWHDGTSEKLVVDFGGGRRLYTYDGSWLWLNNRDDVNAMVVWDNKLVVDFGNGRAMFNYDGSWNWMTNKDDVTRFVFWHDGSAEKLAVDFGMGRGLHYYDGSWQWMRNADDVPEMIAWGNRLAVDFGSGVGIYNYDGTWNWMRNWSTRD